MASADLRDELLCCICLDIFKEPVILRCGHNFCWGCIHQALNTQDESGVYTCPQCRAEFQDRPVLIRNITLNNVAERLLSTQPYQEEVTGICCTYCVDSHVPAVRSCLLCEASLCDSHLSVHSKEADHVLTEPRTPLKNRKCFIHKKVLEYYCTEDAMCICLSCCLLAKHSGHKMESINMACKKKKEKLRAVTQKLKIERDKTEGRVQSLEERWRNAQEKASGENKRVAALFIHIRSQVDNLERSVLSEISSQKEKASWSLFQVIQRLELKKHGLSRKMRHIEDLCDMMDPLTVLQDPDTGDLCDPEEEGGGDEDTDKTHDVDVDEITGMLHEGFYDIITDLRIISPSNLENKRKRQRSPASIQLGSVDTRSEMIYGQGPADIILDVNTAYNGILVSDDSKTATWTQTEQNRPQTIGRFQDFPQVMSSSRFTFGRHYWEVEISGSYSWRVGVCYASMNRRRVKSLIGNNKKSWCLWGGRVYKRNCSVVHNGEEEELLHQITSNRIRICLDLPAKELTFYELRDEVFHLHTFRAIFTEPLHAVLYLYDGSIKISGEAAAAGSHDH